MSASIYHEKLVTPNEKMLAYDLEESIIYFNSICDYIKKEYNELRFEWKFYNKKSGWILKMLNNKRNILFIVPQQKFFVVVFTFGEKASDFIFASNLPECIKQELFKAKKYAEGKTIRLDVKNKIDLDHILALIKTKMVF